MPPINELLVGTAFPAVRPAAGHGHTLHAEAAPHAGAGTHDEVTAAVTALQRIVLHHRPIPHDLDIAVGMDGGVRHYSSQASVQLMFGVPPEEIERTPMPFAAATVVRNSRPGLAIQVNVARWLSAISSRKSAS